MNYRVIVGCFLLIALSQASLAAKVYTWVDEKGVTHYGEHPPKGVTAKKINARTGHSEPVSTTSDSDGPTITENANPEVARQPQSTKDPERCEIARKNLDTLDSKAAIKVPEDDGSLRLITEQERSEKYEEMRSIIAENCE